MITVPLDIRNTPYAHVDHGRPAVDQLRTVAFGACEQAMAERACDSKRSGARARNHPIMAKCTRWKWQRCVSTPSTLLDMPISAARWERILSMVDGVVEVVDALKA